MLTSFFGKSSPLNFVLVSSYVFIIGGLHYVFKEKPGFAILEISTVIGVVAVLIFSVLLLDFTIRKNALTRLHTLGIFIFSCSAAMLPVLFFQLNVALASLFLLLAYRRMFSLRSPKNTEVKILDASIWIGVASLFYFWSLLALFPLYVAIFMMPRKSIRYYLIPLLGGIGLLLIAAAYQLVVSNSLEKFAQWPRKISFDFSAYASWELLVVLSFLLALLVWTLFSNIVDITKGPRKERPNKVLQLYMLGTSLLMVILTNDKTGAELLFLIPPFAIIVAGYIQKKQDLWFKEILLWCFLLLPMVILFI
jgi:hypothetical protein